MILGENQAFASPEEALIHYGKKGMKWGVRNKERKSGWLDPEGRRVEGDVAKAVLGLIIPPLRIFTLPADIRLARGGVRAVKAKVEDVNEKHDKKVEADKKFIEIHNRSTENFNRGIIELNKKHPGDLTKDPKKQKAYDADVEKLMDSSYREAAKATGNTRRDMTLNMKTQNNGKTFKITATPGSKRVKHAAEDEDETFTYTGTIQRASTGHILGFEFDDFKRGEDTLAQSAELCSEFLAHYGKKGMKWGERNEDDTSSAQTTAKKEKTSDRRPAEKEETPKATAARNEVQKQVMEMVVGKPAVDFSKTDSSTSVGDRLKESGFQRDGELSKREKQALLLAGGIGIAAGGFVAYKYMGGNIAMPQAWKVPEGLNIGPLSKSKVGELGHGHDMFELADRQFHNLDTSKGYAIWSPKNNNMPGTVASFADNPFGKQMHDELVTSVDEMRARYPAIRNMNLEVVPMSMVPGMSPMAAQKSGAAVMSIKPGEARIMYNDLMPDGYSAAERMHVMGMMPGLKHDGFTGYHEMGHLLAAAKGDLPPAFDLMSRQPDALDIEGFRDVGKLIGFMKEGHRFKMVQHDLHKDRMKKHGLTYKELRKLSPYAATQPAEALAELAGNYFHPATRAQMSPELAAKAGALFDDLGGVVP